MLAGAAVPLLVSLLESRSAAVQRKALLAMSVLACEELRACEPDAAAATAVLVQHDAAPLLVSLLRHKRCPQVQHKALEVLFEIAAVEDVADDLLRSGAAEALAPLLLGSAASERAQMQAALLLGQLALSSEQRGLKAVLAGAIQALVGAASHGSSEVAESAVGGLLKAAEGAPGVQEAIAAEGGISALEAFYCNHPTSNVAHGTGRLLNKLHAAQQAEREAQQAQQAHGAAEHPSSGSEASSVAGSQPASQRLAKEAPQPAATSQASRQAPHVCNCCKAVAPPGVRFKKCAACQQVSGLLSPWCPWLLCFAAACIEVGECSSAWHGAQSC